MAFKTNIILNHSIYKYIACPRPRILAQEADIYQ